MSTGQEICEAWVRYVEPGLPDALVTDRALRFWNASPGGDLYHVFEAAAVLRAAGKSPSGAATPHEEPET